MVRYLVEQPLPASFMALSIIGFLVATLVVWPLDLTWGFALTVLFTIWFIASVYNFTHAKGEEHLDIHNTYAKVPQKRYRPKAGDKSRYVAVGLALVFGFVSFLYTWRQDKRKFFIFMVIYILVGSVFWLPPSDTVLAVGYLAEILAVILNFGIVLYHLLRADGVFVD